MKNNKVPISRIISVNHCEDFWKCERENSKAPKVLPTMFRLYMFGQVAIAK